MPDYAPSGVLFKNDFKEPGSNKPDVTGTLEISKELLAHLISLDKASQPIKMRLAGWSRSTNGKKRISLLASEERQGAAAPAAAPRAPDPFEDDAEVPF